MNPEQQHALIDPTIEVEIRKTHPAVIVSEDAIGILPLRVIVPLTDWKERYTAAPWMVLINPDQNNGLGKPSAADALQIRSVAQEWFVRHIGTVQTARVKENLNATLVVIGCEDHYPA